MKKAQAIALLEQLASASEDEVQRILSQVRETSKDSGKDEIPMLPMNKLAEIFGGIEGITVSEYKGGVNLSVEGFQTSQSPFSKKGQFGFQFGKVDGKTINRTEMLYKMKLALEYANRLVETLPEAMARLESIDSEKASVTQHL